MDHHNYGHEFRVPSPVHSNTSDQHPPRPQDHSTVHHAPQIPRTATQKPVDDAVNDAFHQAQHETHTQLSPELIAAITQNVIKQLKIGGLEGGSSLSTAPSAGPPPNTAIHHPTPQSPSTTASGTSPSMPNRVYTPPSPRGHAEHDSRASPPLFSGQIPGASHSPTRGPAPSHSHPRRSSSPLSEASDPNDKAYTRPKGPARLSTGKEETTLERIWGQLFDEEGYPTVRLSQLLRGLAVHIIENYEPRHSIVITPNKMCKYYEDVKLNSETYPWSMVFDDEHTSISRLYRDLKCQHHLVQENFDERPDIPALTPVGFARWATLLIQAHPEAEFERLQKAVLAMPISNPDDKKERFPKEISRRLFPGQNDLKIRHMIDEAISEHAAIDIPRHTSYESPHSPSHSQEIPPHKSNNSAQASDAQPPPVSQSHRPSVSFAEPTSASTAPAAYLPSHLERERKPYSTASAESSSVHDANTTNHPQPAVPNPIERERKPYSAQPGGGKSYEEEIPIRNPSKSDAAKPRAETIINNTATSKPSRSDSSARSRPIPVAQPRTMDLPRPEVHHHRAPSNSTGRRQRSPSFSRGTGASLNDFRRAESDVRGYQPTFEPGSVPRDASFNEDDTKRYFDKQARDRAERARRQAEDDSRHYGESPRRERDYDRGSRRGDYGSDDDYYRSSGRDKGSGDGYQQPYGGTVYR